VPEGRGTDLKERFGGGLPKKIGSRKTPTGRVGFPQKPGGGAVARSRKKKKDPTTIRKKQSVHFTALRGAVTSKL